MVMRNKGVLEGNIFSKGNQTLVVAGISEPLLLIQRDAIPTEMSMIELADKRRVPGARTNSGEFNAVVQLAHDQIRDSMLLWFSNCLDRGNGISPNYKRDGILTYNRLFKGNPATEYAGAGRQGQPFQLRLIGLWVMKLEFPEFDMASGDEGDSDAHVTVSFCFDDVEPVGRLRNARISGF